MNNIVVLMGINRPVQNLQIVSYRFANAFLSTNIVKIARIWKSPCLCENSLLNSRAVDETFVANM